MTALTVGQLMPAALQRINAGSVRSLDISRSVILSGTFDSAASPAIVSSYLPSLAKAARAASFMRPDRCSPSTMRCAIIAWTDTPTHLLCNLVKHAADFRLPFRLCCGKQPLPHDRGGLGQQFAKQSWRNVRAQANLLGENSVALGALDQTAETHLGQARAAIFRDFTRDFAIAASDQHIGDGFAQRLSRRNRLQMGLALGSGEVDEIALGQPMRQSENRTGNSNLVVAGQYAQHVRRRIFDGREAPGQLGARFGLDFRDQQAKNSVE